MSYLKGQRISVDKKEKVCRVYCACNNVRPLYYGWTEWLPVRDILIELAGGGLQLTRRSEINKKIEKVVEKYNNIFKERFGKSAWEVISIFTDREKTIERCNKWLQNEEKDSYSYQKAKEGMPLLLDDEKYELTERLKDEFADEVIALYKRGTKRVKGD
jgi:hypothetical protein